MTSAIHSIVRGQAHLQNIQNLPQSQLCNQLYQYQLYKQTFLTSCCTLFLLAGSAQINYNIFNKTPLGQIQINLPQPLTPIPVNITNYTPQQQANFPVQPKQILEYNHLLEQQNQNILKQSNLLPTQPTNAQQAQQLADVERDLLETKLYREQITWLAETKYYRQAYNYLANLNPDSFSLTKAVFEVENAYMDNQLSYKQLTNALKERADLVKQILKRDGLNAKNNLALNYGIQKLYAQPNVFYSAKYNKRILVPSIKYDFDDFRGEKDYSKMFVYKLLATGKGQCHSMPLLYLMIAEQLGAKANLSLAPQHSFIQFKDNAGRLMNFETTNGNLVSNTWLTQSSFINAQALQHKTYLDTLSQKLLYAQMLGDLLLGYTAKFTYDDFAEKIRQKILSINPNNATALIIDANMKTQIAFRKIKAAGSPKEKDLPNYPDAYKAYQDMQEAYTKVDNIGYQDMPKEEYQKWLKSIEREKKKQANQQLQEQMKREMQQLKNMKSSLKTINTNQ